jgi:hypothetical protein
MNCGVVGGIVYINASYILKCKEITVRVLQIVIIYENESCPNQLCCTECACYIKSVLQTTNHQQMKMH